MKYRNLLKKFGEFPRKFRGLSRKLDFTRSYQDVRISSQDVQFAAHVEGRGRFEELPEKFSKRSRRFGKLPKKFRELPKQLMERLRNFADIPQKFKELHR